MRETHVMTPSEALDKAWRTFDCPLGGIECWSEYLWEQSGDTDLINHLWAASALLDGFSVDEITEAGG